MATIWQRQLHITKLCNFVFVDRAQVREENRDVCVKHIIYFFIGKRCHDGFVGAVLAQTVGGSLLSTRPIPYTYDMGRYLCR